jgi:hypothetical protein
LAGMKRPSAKHASQRSFCWSLSWAKKTRQRVSEMPVSSHCLSRRQHVPGLPYHRGSSRHWAPIQRSRGCLQHSVDPRPAGVHLAVSLGLGEMVVERVPFMRGSVEVTLQKRGPSQADAAGL